MSHPLIRRGHHLQLLLFFTLITMVGFAVPRLLWVTHVGYSLNALLLTQIMVKTDQEPNWSSGLYRGLGVLSVGAIWTWLLTPLELMFSGLILGLSWSFLVGWSVIRLVKRFALEPRVNEAVLMGATAGYLHIGLTAGLVMSALETIQPGSFAPLALQSVTQQESVLTAAQAFSALHYYAFVCLTTVGFGDITPMFPLARMLSVATSIAGPLYLAAVMGVLIGRFASSLDRMNNRD